jgi:hypothetical protein
VTQREILGWGQIESAASLEGSLYEHIMNGLRVPGSARSWGRERKAHLRVARVLSPPSGSLGLSQSGLSRAMHSGRRSAQVRSWHPSPELSAQADFISQEAAGRGGAPRRPVRADRGRRLGRDAAVDARPCGLVWVMSA